MNFEQISMPGTASEKKARLVVLISGFGSNLQAILDACESGVLHARVAAVYSNEADAYGLQRAHRSGVPALVKVLEPGQERRDYDTALAQSVAAYRPDWVILAGWMRILTTAFLDCFPNRVVNLHPALPGSFPGTHAIQRAFKAYQEGVIQHTGVMVHLVPDEGVDSGPVLSFETVPIQPEDTLETLEQRIHVVEHRLLLETLGDLIRSEFS